MTLLLFSLMLPLAGARERCEGSAGVEPASRERS